MPKTIEIKGYGEYEFPDSMTDAEIKGVIDTKILKKETAVTGIPLINPKTQDEVIRSYGVDPNSPTLGEDLTNAAGIRARTERGLIGAGQGFMDVGQGLKQKGLNIAEGAQGISNLLGGPQFMDLGASDQYTQEVNQERDWYNNSLVGQSSAGKTGRLVGNMAPYMAVPMGRMATIPQMVGKSTVFGTGVGATQFAPSNSLEENLFNTGVGATAGAVTPLAFKAAAYGGGKAINAMRGRFSDNAEELFGLGKKYDVPVFADDASQSPMLKKATSYTDEIPLIGTRGKRYEQMIVARKSADDMASKFAPQSSDDTGNIIQNSMQRKFEKIRSRKQNLYGNVSKLADPQGPVPVSNMNKAAEEVIAIESQKPAPYIDRNLINQINKYRTDPNMKFSDLQNLRSQIGGRINDLSTGKAPANVQGEKEALKTIKRGLEKDMEQFALNNNAKIKTAWKKADKFYREQYAPMKNNRALQKRLETDEPDRIFDYYIKKGYKDRARNFYKSLDPEGRAAVRSELINRAIEKATQQEGKVFRPSRYASEIEKYNDAADVFFKKADKKYLMGHRKLMGNIEKAGGVFDNPMTGQRNAQLLLLGGGGGLYYLSPEAAAGAASTVYLSKLLLTTEPGKRLLLAASKAKPGSPAMQRIMDDAREMVIKGVDASLSQQSPEEQQQELPPQ